MSNRLLTTVAAAFVLCSAGMASAVALAQVKPSQFEKDSEIKSPAKAVPFFKSGKELRERLNAD